MRTTEARLQRDVGTGRVRQESAERVAERVLQPRHPSTIAAWVSALEELAAQVRGGRIEPWNRSRIRHAAGLIQRQRWRTVAARIDK